MTTTSRREFLSGFGALSALAMSGCKCPFCGGGITRPVALQLWSIHKIFWNDPVGHLAAIRSAGFDGVEFAGFNNLKAAEIGKLLKDAGLRGAGAHLSGDKEYTGDGLKRNLDFCKEAGIESMTSAWADYDTRDGWVKFAELMSKAAIAAEPWGIRIGVHNHCHEFTKKYDGVTALDVLSSASDPRLQLQLDTSQVVNPGLDVPTEIRKFPNRHHSLHMKENVPSKDGFFGVPPDDGGKLVDWEGTVKAIEAEPNFKWYVIECERRPDSLEPAFYNLKFLRNVSC